MRPVCIAMPWWSQTPSARIVREHTHGAEVEKFSETTSGVILALGEVIRRDPAQKDQLRRGCFALSRSAQAPLSTTPALPCHGHIRHFRLARPAAASSFLLLGDVVVSLKGGPDSLDSLCVASGAA